MTQYLIKRTQNLMYFNHEDRGNSFLKKLKLGYIWVKNKNLATKFSSEKEAEKYSKEIIKDNINLNDSMSEKHYIIHIVNLKDIEKNISTQINEEDEKEPRLSIAPIGHLIGKDLKDELEILFNELKERDVISYKSKLVEDCLLIDEINLDLLYTHFIKNGKCSNKLPFKIKPLTNTKIINITNNKPNDIELNFSNEDKFKIIKIISKNILSYNNIKFNIDYVLENLLVYDSKNLKSFLQNLNIENIDNITIITKRQNIILDIPKKSNTLTISSELDNLSFDLQHITYDNLSFVFHHFSSFPRLNLYNINQPHNIFINRNTYVHIDYIENISKISFLTPIIVLLKDENVKGANKILKTAKILKKNNNIQDLRNDSISYEIIKNMKKYLKGDIDIEELEESLILDIGN